MFQLKEKIKTLVRLGIKFLESKLNFYSIRGFRGKEMCLDEE
jgi:hypothetical protein